MALQGEFDPHTSLGPTSLLARSVGLDVFQSGSKRYCDKAHKNVNEFKVVKRTVWKRVERGDC